MIVLVTALALGLIALALTRRRWPGAPLLERLTLAALLMMAMWLSTTWALALLRVLTPTTLTIRAAVALIVALALFRKPGLRIQPIILAALIPIGLWTQFVLWRAAIVPPLTHDALAYHLPKAVLFARAHGFRPLAELEPSARSLPVNYELLLTEIVATQRSDDYTEWPSAAFYLLFVVASGALVQRWWPDVRIGALLAIVLVTAGVPVLLLHAGAHKNDVMTAWLIVGAMIAAGRWLKERDEAALLLLIAAIAMAVGTKPQAAAFAGLLAPFVLWKIRAKILVRGAIFGIAAFLLLGGAAYLAHFTSGRKLVGERADMIPYGDWRNLYEAPYVLAAAPFARNALQLHVPWSDQPWFWRRYELYFSHLGIPFALCLLALPFALIKLEKDVEKIAMTTATLGALVAMLPVNFIPHGMFSISLPRYALFAVPVIFAWTLAPLLQRLDRDRIALGAAVVVFAWYTIDFAKNDVFTPPDFVQWARAHPGTRQIPFDSGRAATIADMRAKPDDTIAIDAAYGSWIHPIFGRNFTRKVHFIRNGVIPDDADWVVIDRTFNIVWGAEGFDDLSEVRRFIGRGAPSEDDLRVRRQLMQDPRFKMVYNRRGENQVVFRRIP